MGDVVKFTPKQFTKPDLDFVAETAPKYLAFAGRLEAISDDIAEATAMIEEGATWLPVFLETVQSYMAMLRGGQKFLDAEAEGNFANLQRHLNTLIAGGYVRRDGPLCHFTLPGQPLAKVLLRFLPD